LSEDEINDLSRNYRRVLSDLVVAKSSIPDQELISYLNSLAVKTHNLIFSGSPVNPWSLKRFITETFPETVRKNIKYLILAALVMLTAALTAYAIVYFKFDGLYKLLPPLVVNSIGNRDIGSISNDAPSAYLSSFVMTNNIRVIFLAISAGFLFGLGSVYILWINGLIVGGLAAIAQKAGHSLGFWSLILPHGVVEFPAIFISGAAGLIIGHSLLAPGRLTRTASLRRTSKTVFNLLGGVVFLLIIAGIIEGFFTPKHLPISLKYGFSITVFGLLVLYLSGLRRKAPR
jgi:uncharacterized membrane protein SpoIIM required for sporulation